MTTDTLTEFVEQRDETHAVSTDPTGVEVVEIEFDELGRFESLSMCCSMI